MPILIDSAKLSPGDYRLEANGRTLVPRLTVVSPVRRSAASMQDESAPRPPKLPPEKDSTAGQRAASRERHWDGVAQTVSESGVSAVVLMGADDVGRQESLDTLARSGAIMLANPDTRPMSFNPPYNDPDEIGSMSQRMILAAQANGRSPNFAGYCFGWDTTGYPVGGRRGLLVYWGWGQNEQPLRNYIDRADAGMVGRFRRQTGLEPVTEREYVSYLLSVRRPEFATMIDLPTKRWLEAIARHTKPMADAERREFEKRLDAWSAFLMGQYGEVYGHFRDNLRAVSPSMRNTASVQVDHQAVRNGQYFPSAYAPLDLRYQSTWNDQVGGPDYAYQWLLTAGLLDMHRSGQPTWLSNAMAAAHARAAYPGKLTRVAAHGLAYGVSGTGFALEGFSNVLGGMNGATNWENIKGHSGAPTCWPPASSSTGSCRWRWTAGATTASACSSRAASSNGNTWRWGSASRTTRRSSPWRGSGIPRGSSPKKTCWPAGGRHQGAASSSGRRSRCRPTLSRRSSGSRKTAGAFSPTAPRPSNYPASRRSTSTCRSRSRASRSTGRCRTWPRGTTTF